MAYQQIAIQAVPSQDLAVVLNGQSCGVSLRELDGRQYFSLTLNGVVICRNILIQDRLPLASVDYGDLVGDFMSLDTQGATYPLYTGWGTRWVLLYKD
jgi:hypothetical protein